MKSYCSLRRQLNLYGILIQGYDPSRTFSFQQHVLLSPADKKKNYDGTFRWTSCLFLAPVVAVVCVFPPPFLMLPDLWFLLFALASWCYCCVPALLYRGVSSSGVYSHPLLRQDRLDLAARIPRTGIPARRKTTRVPTPPLVPPRERHHFGGSTFFIRDTTTSTTTTSATTRNTTAATPIADTTLYVALSSEYPNSSTDYYNPDKDNSDKNYYDISTSSTPTSSTSTVMASCPETKNSTTSLPNVFLAPLLDHAEPTARFFLSLMNGSGGELRLDDQQQEYFFHPSSSSYRNSAAAIPTSTVSLHADDHDDVVTTSINDNPNQLAISCSIRLQEQHQHQQSFSLLLRHSTTILHDEDIRLEIIQTFL
jgi:hypothetical protein